jgi:hypothetical protein
VAVGISPVRDIVKLPDNALVAVAGEWHRDEPQLGWRPALKASTTSITTPSSESGFLVLLYASQLSCCSAECREWPEDWQSLSHMRYRCGHAECLPVLLFLPLSSHDRARS